VKKRTTGPLFPFFAVLLCLTSCGGTNSDPSPEAMDTQSQVDEPIDPEAIRPFEINVPESTLVDLRLRLSQRRLPDQIAGTGWEYGTDRTYLEELLAYWEDGFDWRKQEAELNKFDQFKTSIDGLDIHFLHQRSTNEDALPLLITHGWPGSFAEFTKVLGPLTDPASYGGDPADAFHVVIPSLPGFGFSDKPTERGFDPERMTDIFAKLMEKLGYERYVTQGGDWGSIISRWHAFKYPDRVAALHLTMLLAAPPPGVDDPTAGVPASELERMRERQAFMANETGYQGIQGTKPQTLGYGLHDSPAGLAGWIVEKFHGWSDINGNIESKFTKDELLTNIMVYWVTGTITSSTRIYYESRNVEATEPLGFVEVPTAALIFPAELYIFPRQWAEAWYNLVRWTEIPDGGHFAALEEPEVFLDDVRTFFRDYR